MGFTMTVGLAGSPRGHQKIKKYTRKHLHGLPGHVRKIEETEEKKRNA